MGGKGRKKDQSILVEEFKEIFAFFLLPALNFLQCAALE